MEVEGVYLAHFSLPETSLSLKQSSDLSSESQ